MAKEALGAGVHNGWDGVISEVQLTKQLEPPRSSQTKTPEDYFDRGSPCPHLTVTTQPISSAWRAAQDWTAPPCNDLGHGGDPPDDSVLALSVVFNRTHRRNTASQKSSSNRSNPLRKLSRCAIETAISSRHALVIPGDAFRAQPLRSSIEASYSSRRAFSLVSYSDPTLMATLLSWVSQGVRVIAGGARQERPPFPVSCSVH